MTYALEVLDEANADMREAYLWYQLRREGLGDEFILSVEECLQNLSEHPEHYTHLHPRWRRVRLRRFPYQVFYEIEGETVIITRVRHEGRKPLA